MSYTVNQTIRWTLESRVDEVLTEPTDVTLILTAPDKTKTTLTKSGVTLTSLAVGRYRAKHRPVLAGLWWWSLETTGPAAGYAEGNFQVDPSRVPVL